MYPIRLVRLMVTHFASLAGYDGELYVTDRRENYERIRLSRRDSVELDDNLDYGICLRGNPPAIWINPKTNTTFSRLARTCAHEALHAAQLDFPHGPFFDKAVRRLLNGLEP